MKRRIGHLLCLLVLILAVPFALLAGLGRIVTWASRWISERIIGASLRIERKFMIDPESDHEAWRKRMKAKREAGHAPPL